MDVKEAITKYLQHCGKQSPKLFNKAAKATAASAAAATTVSTIRVARALACSHRGERVAPPATATEEGVYPAFRIASNTSSVPRHTDSISPRNMCPLPEFGGVRTAGG